MNLRAQGQASAGVTLVEMIAVVAVVVILAGIVSFRAGKTPEAARTAAALSLVKDCRTAYVQMFFDTNFPEGVSISLSALVAGSRFGAVHLSRNGNILTVSNFPAGTFKQADLTELSIDCSANTYKWLPSSEFKPESEFRTSCLW